MRIWLARGPGRQGDLAGKGAWLARGPGCQGTWLPRGPGCAQRQQLLMPWPPGRMETACPFSHVQKASQAKPSLFYDPV